MNKVTKLELIDFEAEGSLNSPMVINCFEREEIRFSGRDAESDEPTKEDALSARITSYNVCYTKLLRTKKNRKNMQGKLELNKYCPFERKHTLHKETKVK